MTIAPCAWASVASARRVGRLHEPGLARSSTGWTRRTTVARPSARGASKSAARVRFVVPTSISLAPARRTISGIRTPPPISTSSPRETATPRRPASPTASDERGRVVDRDQRVLGAGQRDQVLLGDAEARPAPAGVAVELEERIARRPRALAAAIAAAGQGARPRLVWRITPVALMTVTGPAPRHPGAAKPSSRPATAAARAATSVGGSPAASRGAFAGDDLPGDRRQRVRIATGGQQRPGRDQQPLDARGTRAIRQSRSSVAGTRGSRTHRAAPSAAPLVLKTRGPTGTRPLPARW